MPTANVREPVRNVRDVLRSTNVREPLRRNVREPLHSRNVRDVLCKLIASADADRVISNKLIASADADRVISNKLIA